MSPLAQTGYACQAVATMAALWLLGRQAIIDWTRYLRAKWEEGNDNDFS